MKPRFFATPPQFRAWLQKHHAAERELLSREKIEVVLAKNSGGDASYPKIAAARELGIEVVLVERPKRGSVETVESVPDAVSLARQRLGSR